MFLFHMALDRRLVFAGLALAAALMLAAPASAQQGWQFYGGAGRPGYNAPAAAGYTYSGGYYSSPGFAGGGTPGYLSTGSAYYAPTYVYGTPAYGAPGYLYGGSFSPGATAAYYGETARNNEAVIDLRVPAGAVVKFDGKATSQTGAERRFVSPPLKEGQDYSYDVMVQWQDGGRNVERHRTIDVRAGKRVNLDFTRGGEG
jgi:uncharacterized protein (TIGR03000 family)